MLTDAAGLKFKKDTEEQQLVSALQFGLGPQLESLEGCE